MASLHKIIKWVFWGHLIMPGLQRYGYWVHSTFHCHLIVPVYLIGHFIQFSQSILSFKVLSFQCKWLISFFLHLLLRIGLLIIRLLLRIVILRLRVLQHYTFFLSKWDFNNRRLKTKHPFIITYNCSYHFLRISYLAFKNDSKCFWTSLSRIFEAKIEESTDPIVFYLYCCFKRMYFSKSSWSCFAFFFCKIWMFYISSLRPLSFWEVSLYLYFDLTISYRIFCSYGSSASLPETRSLTAFNLLSYSSWDLSFPILSLDWWISVASYFPSFIFYRSTSAFFCMASCLLEETLKA